MSTSDEVGRDHDVRRATEVSDVPEGGHPADYRTPGRAQAINATKAVGRGIPRPGMAVYAEGSDEPLGELTSGTFSPTLRTGIGLALIGPEIKVGDTVTGDIRGRREPFLVVKPPFVEPSTKEA